MSTRHDALSVPCPYCHANSGRPCSGLRGPRSACHSERHLAYVTAMRKAEAEQHRHPAELSLWEAPEPYHHAPEDTGLGRVEVPISDAARERGLRNAERMRAAIAKHQHRSRPEPTE